jgi:hypothetical protein
MKLRNWNTFNLILNNLTLNRHIRLFGYHIKKYISRLCHQKRVLGGNLQLTSISFPNHLKHSSIGLGPEEDLPSVISSHSWGSTTEELEVSLRDIDDM